TGGGRELCAPRGGDLRRRTGALAPTHHGHGVGGRDTGRSEHTTAPEARSALSDEGTIMAMRTIAAAASLMLAAPCLADTGTRTSGFDYESSSPLMTKEVIEPVISNLCLVTTYLLDNYGNRTTTTTRNCAGASGVFLNEAGAPTIADPV